MSVLWQLTAADLAARIASKKVSCTEVVEAHLRRISCERWCQPAAILPVSTTTFKLTQRPSRLDQQQRCGRL